MNMRRLYIEDKEAILDLIRSRVSDTSHKKLSVFPHDKLIEILDDDTTYEVTHRVFGLIDGNRLDTVFIVKIIESNLSYGVVFTVSDKNTSKPIVNGYNKKSTDLLEYSIKEMEKEGYYIFYSAIPNHPRWKRAEKNENLGIKGTYNISEVEIISPGELPKNSIFRHFIHASSDIERVVRKMTKKDMPINM